MIPNLNCTHKFMSPRNIEHLVHIKIVIQFYEITSSTLLTGKKMYNVRFLTNLLLIRKIHKLKIFTTLKFMNINKYRNIIITSSSSYGKAYHLT